MQGNPGVGIREQSQIDQQLFWLYRGSDEQFQQNSSVEIGSGVPFSHRAVLCNEVRPQMAKTHMFLACVLGT
jgi:hypothetical protein